jgi:hypothetical protein
VVLVDVVDHEILVASDVDRCPEDDPVAVVQSIIERQFVGVQDGDVFSVFAETFGEMFCDLPGLPFGCRVDDRYAVLHRASSRMWELLPYRLIPSSSRLGPTLPRDLRSSD